MGTCSVSKLYCTDSREQVSLVPQLSPEVAQFGPCCVPGNVEPGINNGEILAFRALKTLWVRVHWGGAGRVRLPLNFFVNYPKHNTQQTDADNDIDADKKMIGIILPIFRIVDLK